MSSKSRTETGVKEIKEILSQLQKDKMTVNVVNENNVMIPVTITKLEEEAEAFQIALKNKKQIKYIVPGQAFSLGCGRDGSVYNFVAKCLDDGPYVIRFELPGEMTILEQREHKRFGTLTLQNPYIEVGVDDGQEAYLMNDLSQGGLSFLVPKYMSNKFEPKQIVEIYRIGKQTFKKPITAEIRHISQSAGGMKSTLKIGVRFLGKPSLKG
jgi:c-di-GMP-binding flagellar brake protein YcgR